MGWQRGLDASQAVSGNGRYREQAGDDVMALATCVWRGLELVTLGDAPRALLAPELPAEHRVRLTRRSWTGKAVEYRWRGGGLTIDLRTTLPGPLFTAVGRSLRLRWPSGSEPQRITSLTDDCAFGSQGLADADGRRIWLASGPHMPVLLVASAPVTAVRLVSHMHWEVEFARAGASLLVVPLLGDDDIPRDAERQARWLSLAAHPPLTASERFREAGDRLVIEGRFPGARLAPLPPWFTLLGDRGGLLDLPKAEPLLATWCGPYATVAGNRWQATIAMGWSRARLEATATVGGTLADPPEEMAYAGDANWVPGSAMDQLLSLRSWAPLLAAAPAAVRESLITRLAPPSAAEFAAGVEVIAEPASGRPWARLRQMWDHTGDACYDIDWYNGLALSGLARAVECGVEAIAAPARRVARACRRERTALSDYFAVFNDWALGPAWSDPRGWLWNADCCHNGLEGILAEARLCAVEGRHGAVARLRYLAARTAVGLRASMEMPAWIKLLDAGRPTPRALTFSQSRMVTWSPTGGVSAPADAPDLGVQALVSWREITWCTTATRNPYVLAGTFPEWNALLAAHGPVQALRALAEQPERDWIRAYLGDDWRARQARGDQEARIQAAVFYHLAPIIAFRRLVLGESAVAIEGSYAAPLNLAEQLLVRGGFRCAIPGSTLARKAMR